MAVNALELRPRTTLALFDSALKLCARTLGVWAITLPAGAALVAATFELVDAVHRHRSLIDPALWFTAAWLFRAVSQGAAAHYLERMLLEPNEPSARASFWAALKRAPALLYAAGFCLVLNAIVWCFSLGIGYLLLGAHLAAYAVVMKGRGSLLGLYGTCSAMLGPARHAASWLRLAGLTQILVAYNLHLGVNAALSAASKLLALNVTFVTRFASLDNPVWVAAVLALTFALFEPLRAACAALLLIDGRVRQEGLDLLTQLEQLPQRRKKGLGAPTTPKPSPSAIAGVLLAVLLAPSMARAGDDWSGNYIPGEQPVDTSTAMSTRLDAVVQDCALEDRFSPAQLHQVDKLPQSSQGALSRFVSRIERIAEDEENCEGAGDELERGLKQIESMQADVRKPDSADARNEAIGVLGRSEFAVDPPEVKKPKEPEDDMENPVSKWIREQWEAFLKWLFGPDKPERRTSVDLNVPGFGGIQNLVMFAAIGLVIGLLLWLLLRGLSRPEDAELSGAEEGGILQTPLAPDPMNALSRPPEGWAGIADELAAKGHYREAIRNLYLALLSRLHRDGAIDYDPAKSNWDYFRGFKGPMTSLTPFRELTRRFDFAWYGNLEVSPDAWRTFRSITQPLLEMTPQKERQSA
jgi:hypothetical protein